MGVKWRWLGRDGGRWKNGWRGRRRGAGGTGDARAPLNVSRTIHELLIIEQ